MRTDILELHHFYQNRLGGAAQSIIAGHLLQLWPNVENQRIAGFGYVTPFLQEFPQARARLELAPDAQGIIRWPPRPAPNSATLVHEGHWPLPDRSMDRILIVHGLEEVRDASRLLREIWRVLADDGRLIIVAAQRRGLWAQLETNPFAAGRPWLKGQLSRLLENANFHPFHWKRALHFPPWDRQFLLRASSGLERAGRILWPGFCGILIVEAGKQMLTPVTGLKSPVIQAIRPKIAKRFAPQSLNEKSNQSKKG